MSEKDVLRLNRPVPPPLPPRAPSHPLALQPQAAIDPSFDAPPSYDSIFTREPSDVRPSLGADDPRTSPTQSLKPVRSSSLSDKRRLLLIYIHGFMGNETSFQSFPAHVHNLVADLVHDSHTVHTKLYPRYKSKKNIEFARDDFSRWLAPHEASTTDVILLGHSMGGLVSAEVALSQVPPSHQLRHHILGTINFDVPFLGMHPSVIKSGLASIFNPAPEPSSPQAEVGAADALPQPHSGNASTADHAPVPPALPPRRTNSFPRPLPSDPNYNPDFDNDVRLPVRKGWRSAWHFINKHNEDLLQATKQLVKSHMEFGGAMADFDGLKSRYCRIRALEEQNVDVRASIMSPSCNPPRVRFVNYYTSSTGRPSKPKASSLSPVVTEENATSAEPPSANPPEQPEGSSVPPTAAQPPQVPVEDPATNLGESSKQSDSEEPLVLVEHEDQDNFSEYDLEEANEAMGESMDHLEPLPMSDGDGDGGGADSDTDSWADAMEDIDKAEAEHTDKVIAEHADQVHAEKTDKLHEDPSVPDERSLASPTDESKSILTSEPTLTRENTQSTVPAASTANESTLSLATTTSLPPIPDAPPRPVDPDFSVYVDKETRKLAEKDHSRALKTWERAVRDRDRAIRDREKLEEKRQRQIIKEGKRAEREEEKEIKRKQKEQERADKQKQKVKDTAQEQLFEIQRRDTEREWKETLEMKWNDEDGTVTPMDSSHAPSIAPSTADTTAPSLLSVQTSMEAKAKPEKPRKERNFCTLPPKDSSGNRDPTWVKVFMPDVDEVGAHCGLFFETSPAYEQLVGDVSEKISQWASEAESERVAAELAVFGIGE